MTNEKDIFSHSQEILDDAECLYTEEEVFQAINRLASEVNEKLKDTNPIVVTVMNGGLIPAGLLLPKLSFPLQIDYIHATRYGENTKGGELDWISNPSLSMENRTILLIDDIHDEGNTIKSIRDYCIEQKATKVYSCVLIHKNHNRKCSPKPDFVGLEVPDRYLFGYGMDYKTLLRNAPGIFAVKGM